MLQRILQRAVLGGSGGLNAGARVGRLGDRVRASGYFRAILISPTTQTATLAVPPDGPGRSGDLRLGDRFDLGDSHVLPALLRRVGGVIDAVDAVFESIDEDEFVTLLPALRKTFSALDPDEVDDLARALRGELLSRRYGDAVRLEVADNCPKPLTDFLLKQFGLTEAELYEVNGPVNLTRLFSITGLENHPQLQFPPFSPGLPRVLSSADNLFQAISKQDILLQHPYESFSPVVDLLRQAAQDPNVLAIKQTLYRTGANSEIVNALVDAARNGKEVTVVIELRARFDEESNLQLASRLQQAGAVVIYGVVGFKTHAKMMLILRREEKNLKRYVHLGTGNYHAGNARLYTDYSILTSDVALTEDVHKLFNQLIGMGKTQRMKKLLQAPFTLKKRLLELINRETMNAQAGKPAHIIAKANSLTDAKIIKALYKASQCGVKIDLIVRGMCCLRPGIPGVSHNITVRSIIGRFLEHSRVYYFLNDGQEQVWMSSADMMERNLDKRVETCFPLEGKKLITRAKQELQVFLTDNTRSWILQPDGTYLLSSPSGNQIPRSAQATLLEKLASPQRTVNL